MSAYFSPCLNDQQFDASGNPLASGFIYTYAAGSTTPIATFTASDGLTPQANPITLNSTGFPANPIWIGGGTSVKFVLKDSNLVTLRTIDNVQGVNDPSTVATQDEWVAFSGVPTFLSATSFSVAGDQTLYFQVGRRVKTSNSGGTVYSTISGSSFGAGITTVTVVNDSGTLDAALSAVSYALLSVTNPSLPETTLGKSLRTVVSVVAAKALLPIQSATLQATTSGTSIDFTSIPSWVKKITVGFSGVSTNGTSNLMVQIGDSGGIETTGYLGSAVLAYNAGSAVAANFTTGFGVTGSVAATSVLHGLATISLLNAATNTWSFSISAGYSDAPGGIFGGGTKSLSATLDRLRLTTVGGADTFDAGSVNILYE